jgi:hypothetical protein
MPSPKSKNMTHLGSNLGASEGGFGAVKGNQAEALVDETNPPAATAKGVQAKNLVKLTQNPVFPIDTQQSIG